MSNVSLILVEHKATGLYHLLSTVGEMDAAAAALVAYWNNAHTRTHRKLNHAADEFCKWLAPFSTDDFTCRVLESSPTVQESRGKAILEVSKRGTDLLLTAGLGYTGGSWTLNVHAKNRMANNTPPPYVAVKGNQPVASILRAGSASLMMTGDRYRDVSGQLYDKVTPDELATLLGGEYTITVGRRGALRVYKKHH